MTKKSKKVTFNDQEQDTGGDSTPTAAIIKNEVKLDHNTKEIVYWLKVSRTQVKQM
jgi:hypothetical protein